jgi:hypothetical protein
MPDVRARLAEIPEGGSLSPIVAWSAGYGLRMKRGMAPEQLTPSTGTDRFSESLGTLLIPAAKSRKQKGTRPETRNVAAVLKGEV